MGIKPIDKMGTAVSFKVSDHIAPAAEAHGRGSSDLRGCESGDVFKI